MQMDASLSSNVDFKGSSIRSTGSAMSRKVRAMRMKISGTMDAQALNDEALSMEQIVQEEDQKQE